MPKELNPHAGLRFLGKSFSETFANWPWATHVVLQGEMMRFRKMGMTECPRCPLDCPAAHINTASLILHKALSIESGLISSRKWHKKVCLLVKFTLSKCSTSNGFRKCNEVLRSLGVSVILWYIIHWPWFLILNTMICAFWHCKISWGLILTGIVYLNLLTTRRDIHGFSNLPVSFGERWLGRLYRVGKAVFSSSHS